jgi:hypothetical protein
MRQGWDCSSGNLLRHLDQDCARRVPVAYIGAEVAMADLPRFRTLCPQLITAQTLGSGHFSTLEMPDQVNAMLARLLEIGPSRSRTVRKIPGDSVTADASGTARRALAVAL